MDEKTFKTEKLEPPKINIPIPDLTPYVSARLYFDGGIAEGYRLAEFNIGFSQVIDYKGQPKENEFGGIMEIVINQVTDAAIDSWVMKSRDIRNGSVIFRQHGSKVLTIEYKQAYCTECRQSVNHNGGVSTQLIISPNIISLNGIDHNNHWAL